MRRSTLLVTVTVGFAVLYLAAALALGSPPGSGDDAKTISTWFDGHDTQVHTWLELLVLSTPLFATYVALVREHLPAPHRDVFAVGAIAFVAETAVQGWLWAALTRNTTDPSTVRTVYDVASYWGPVLTSTTIAMLAPVAAAAWNGSGGLPRWLAFVAGVAVVEQLVETVTIFGRTGFFAPGGAMNNGLGAALVAIALICLGLTAARKPVVVVAAGQ